MKAPLLLVGCGKMGAALVAGWLDRGLDPSGLSVVEPSPSPKASSFAARGARVVADAGALPRDFRPATIVLAVKPQAMDAAIAPLQPYLAGKPLVVSIAAGRTIAAIESRLGTGLGVVRAMPNTPAAIGRGITVLCAGKTVSAAQREDAEALMGAVGETAWIEREEQMDAVTALSGSGPAYVFLLAETMAEAGAAAGLDPVLARRLARATVVGAGAMLEKSAQEPAALRADVTSPGGTTAAALALLMADGGLGALMRRAIDAAARRARELARQ